jgi:hypothetical protein
MLNWRQQGSSRSRLFDVSGLDFSFVRLLTSLNLLAPPYPVLLLCRPGDKRIVREAGSEADIWWGGGSTNFEMDER